MCHVQYLLWESTHIANEADYQWSHLTRSNNTTEKNVCYLLHSIKSLNTSHFNMDFKKQAFAFLLNIYFDFCCSFPILTCSLLQEWHATISLLSIAMPFLSFFFFFKDLSHSSSICKPMFSIQQNHWIMLIS